MEKLYFEDYTLGERFVSPARTITEADIINFASLTGDWHPLHTDVEYAKSTPFGERIAHGMLTLPSAPPCSFGSENTSTCRNLSSPFTAWTASAFTTPSKSATPSTAQ